MWYTEGRDFMDNVKYEKLHKGMGTDHLLYNEDDPSPYTGVASSWYKNGQLRFEGMYKKGVLHGKSTWWHRNGRIEYEAVYVHGKLKEFIS